jgi:hypothetical protein
MAAASRPAAIERATPHGAVIRQVDWQGSTSPGEQAMSDEIEPQNIESAEFEDELSDEALDRQEAALSGSCRHTLVE